MHARTVRIGPGHACIVCNAPALYAVLIWSDAFGWQVARYECGNWRCQRTPP